ncbi:MAG TPA: hypothetical protein VJ276_05765, partial [Thermoanaerobaculia bacterium]|nr:hypothetical protein [Thermoanaerobaculia bacterium]
GMPAGETARVRDDDGAVVLTYRSFASVVGIVAALVAGVVIVAGIAGTLFLVAEGRPVAAIAAFALSIFFTGLVAMLVPSTSVTLYDGSHPALTLSQRSRFSFPSAIHAVATPEGRTLAYIRKSAFSRLGRNRWTVISPADGREVGHAVEESFGGAIVRKVLGKFDRRFQTNLRVAWDGQPAGWIHRRAGDMLEVSGAIDRRVAVALATLVLGSEP